MAENDITICINTNDSAGSPLQKSEYAIGGTWETLMDGSIRGEPFLRISIESPRGLECGQQYLAEVEMLFAKILGTLQQST